MINARGHNAVIYCNGCQSELAEGPYPSDAEDNLPQECWIVGEEDRPNEHYCASCYTYYIEQTPNT